METHRRGRATRRSEPVLDRRQNMSPRTMSGRVQKRSNVPSHSRKTLVPQKSDSAVSNHEARDVSQPPGLPGLGAFSKVPRSKPSIHACSELSLAFVTEAGLETDDYTNTITLNLMDHFLFSEANWAPELSYCNLHAACFYFASIVTNKNNTVEEIAKSLGPESAFVQLMASPLADDEDAAAAICEAISVGIADVERGYDLLHERRKELTSLVGEYASALDRLPLRNSLLSVGQANSEEDEDLDRF